MAFMASRRNFLKTAAATGTALPALGSLAHAAAHRIPTLEGPLRHAGIGAGGMGASDLRALASHPQLEVVALCDVDRGRLEEAGKLYPNARLYQDWRELLREEKGKLDSASISTPDHMHAPITWAAMHAGLHVYCQKPLTHTVIEARRLAEAAERLPVVTQMGIQNHSNPPYSQARALFLKKPVGKIREVHAWTDRPAGWWPQGVDRPEGEDTIPEGLDWDAWLGVAPKRPYKNGVYHAFAWRGRLDFGTGAQGDMACHIMDPAPWFLELGNPLSVHSAGPPPTEDTFPLWSKVTYEFAPTPWTSDQGVRVVWHDGKRKPDDLLKSFGAQKDAYANGSLFVGEKGAMMFSPYEPPRLLPKESYQEHPIPKGGGTNHWHQWVDACLGKGAASAPFSYSSKLTEIALLGNIALHFPEKTLTWDSQKMSFGLKKADTLLHKTYRKGWSQKGLG